MKDRMKQFQNDLSVYYGLFSRVLIARNQSLKNNENKIILHFVLKDSPDWQVINSLYRVYFSINDETDTAIDGVPTSLSKSEIHRALLDFINQSFSDYFDVKSIETEDSFIFELYFKGRDNLTLESIALDYVNHNLSDNELQVLLSKIDIVDTPVINDLSEVNSENQVDSNGNSWEDVRTDLVDTGKLSLIDYGNFYKKVTKLM